MKKALDMVEAHATAVLEHSKIVDSEAFPSTSCVVFKYKVKATIYGNE